MNRTLSSRDFFLLLLTGIIAGSYLLTRYFELVPSFVDVSKPFVTSAANIDISMDLSWHAPISSTINSLSSAINGTGIYSFVFNSSTLPKEIAYGIFIFF